MAELKITAVPVSVVEIPGGERYGLGCFNRVGNFYFFGRGGGCFYGLSNT